VISERKKVEGKAEQIDRELRRKRGVARRRKGSAVVSVENDKLATIIIEHLFRYTL